MIIENAVVQFNENHKWCGCIGIVEEVNIYDNDVRYKVGIPTPDHRMIYTLVNKSDNELEYIGIAVMVPKN